MRRHCLSTLLRSTNTTIRSYSPKILPSNHFSGEESDHGSAVYRHALKFQRPSVIKWQQHLDNSASFIGSVQYPLKLIATKNGRFGAYTLLSVARSRESDRALSIMLKMWDEVGQISWKHMKVNDLVYVCGRLESYTKSLDGGELKRYYEVIVKEWNYVMHNGPGVDVQSDGESNLGGGCRSGNDKERFHLWQVFFANPHEWWDNRKSKPNPRQPDFVHKDTREALWLRASDPSWIKRQLELLDSKMEEKRVVEHNNSRSHISPYVYND